MLVAGLGISGRAAAQALTARGARVTTYDDAAAEADERDAAAFLARDGLALMDLVVT